MRIYDNCYELASEIMRDVNEMGIVVHPLSMQNKDVSDDENFKTKELINYSYCLKKLEREDVFFIFDETSKKWLPLELAERLSSVYINPGNAYKIRPHVWREFINEEGEFDYSYNERIEPSRNLDLVLKELRRNPDSRQAIIAIWDRNIDVKYLGGKKRVPCSIYYQFLIRNGKLHIIYSQRSADLVTHLFNDIWLAFRFKSEIAKFLGYEDGFLYHNIGSLHVYKKDWEILKTGISNLIHYGK